MKKNLLTISIATCLLLNSTISFSSDKVEGFTIDPKPLNTSSDTFAIDKKPINSVENKKEIKKIQQNTKEFFNELNTGVNKVEINGQKVDRNKIVAINDGQIILTPINKEKEDAKKIPLPKHLQSIEADVEWVDYQKPKEKEVKKDSIIRPEGFFESKNPNEYIDSFFDEEIVDTDKNKDNIKKGMGDVLNTYFTDNTKQDNTTQIKPLKPEVKIEPKLEPNSTPKPNLQKTTLDKGLDNLMDLYNNKDRKETLGFTKGDKIKNKPMAIMSHTIPDNLKGKPVYIRIFKEDNALELYLYDHGKYKLANVYTICTFSGGLGPKKRQGDMKSPEGFYSFSPNSFNPFSQYYKSIDLGFPNEYDRSHGYSGSLLMVHGGCKSIGCYAMTDNYIQEIYDFAEKALKNGQQKVQVDVFPFRMNEENLKKHGKNENIKFWKTLKKGYDIFEKTGKPPTVTVKNKEYIFVE